MSKPSYAQLIILLIPAAFLVAYWDACLLARLVDLELPLWLKICWSYYVVVALHVTTMALVGTLWLRVPIELMKLGSGRPSLLTNIATVPVSFGILFFAGSVRFA